VAAAAIALEATIAPSTTAIAEPRAIPISL
jgi:hypothetical protein